MTSAAPLAIGVDLGATKIAAALVSRDGHIIATQRQPTTPDHGPKVVLANIAQVINELLHQTTRPVGGVGIGAPGQVDPIGGSVRNAVNLGWYEVALISEINDRLEVDLPIHIQRDVNAELLGETYFGTGVGCDNLIYLGLGSGLGGAAMVNGRLVIGDQFSASEIGHLTLDPKGRPCACGRRGCAETILSGPGLLAITHDYLSQRAYPTGLSASAELTPAMVVAAAEAGDPLAQAVFAEMARWLGAIMAAYVSILNPARIVIGGGLGRAAFNILLPGVQTELGQRVLPISYRHLELVQSRLASSAVGAACLVWYT
jgi:glucokinase